VGTTDIAIARAIMAVDVPVGQLSLQMIRHMIQTID
jgi:hypothetical protein